MKDEGLSILDKRSWEEFRKTGLLWWINRTLHLFGWAIVVVVEGEDGRNDGTKILDVYPARTRFRGFHEAVESDGFVKLTTYLSKHGSELLIEAQEG